MLKRSLFECSVSKKCKVDKSDLANNKEFVPMPASSDQPQQPTKKQKSLSATPGMTHSPFLDVWFDHFDWVEYNAQSKRMFSKVCHEHFLKWRCRCVFFVVLIAYFSTFCPIKK